MYRALPLFSSTVQFQSTLCVRASRGSGEDAASSVSLVLLVHGCFNSVHVIMHAWHFLVNLLSCLKQLYAIFYMLQ